MSFLATDEYHHVKVDESIFTGIQGRKETLGNPTDNEIRALLKVCHVHSNNVTLIPPSSSYLCYSYFFPGTNYY